MRREYNGKRRQRQDITMKRREHNEKGAQCEESTVNRECMQEDEIALERLYSVQYS